MMHNTRHKSLVGAIGVIGAMVILVVLTACGGSGSTSGPGTGPAATTPSTTTAGGTAANTQSTSGSVTPSGPVRVGSIWMLTVHSARAYPNGWNAPVGMAGNWGHMGRGYMAVVLDVSAQSSATPVPSTGSVYAGPVCALRGGWGMMGGAGPMMGSGAYGWQMMAPGIYRGPMAYMAPNSTRQFTLVCTDPNSGTQASWQIGF